VHLLLGANYHEAKLSNSSVEKLMGVATNRNLKVIRTLAEKWGE
jgi:predicted transcriptional regulator